MSFCNDALLAAVSTAASAAPQTVRQGFEAVHGGVHMHVRAPTGGSTVAGLFSQALVGGGTFQLVA